MPADPRQPATTEHFRGVIVAGMHRSSTSLITSLFAAAGYWMPDDQLPARSDNPLGYFEDRRMHQLHRRMLESYHASWGFAPRLRQLRGQDLEIADHLREEADALVALYRAHEPWVWKNPRVTLWLEAWAREFPEAVFVICVRRPEGVVDSMLRRKDRLRISNKQRFARLRRGGRATSTWYSYNSIAWRFARRHPERTVVVRIPEDLPALDRATGQSLFHPKMLRKPRAKVRLPLLFALRTRWLYHRLAARADPATAARLIAQPPNSGR